MRVSFEVDGAAAHVDGVWAGESLLYLLRERMGLPGPGDACHQGECGSCTVYLDGVSASSCLVAAGQAHGRSVRTVADPRVVDQ
ncbi:2Fe-2S iron-sulfur cluster-binding protein [Nocardia mexicana]|uniref:2Fe-2S iron-sulfur cluster protein n=1 Tax=Nocardia mexicana TaxID=279262 RepID=A0A370HCE6_9NOCA|nr:2Fe-2S iron-sulfur cluster-binding protein [Nocardia mexicana]RDI54045.1 2Fe-2S iron-sulfur cluster protein [Nocardia mexicana]